MYPYLNLFDTQISVYFLFLSFVFSLVVPILVKRAEKLELSTHSALDLYLVVLLGSFLGARAFYIIYQEPTYFIANPEQILYFWNGGYVFFGGFLGSVFAGGLFSFYKKMHFELWFNFAIPVLSLGYAIGRLACFLSGCCYGKETEVVWSVVMHGASRHPTQLYASFMEFAIFLALLFIEKKKGFESYLVLPVWLILHGFARAVMEHYRADPRGGEVLGLSISTLVSLILIGVGAILLYYKKVSSKNTG